MIFKHPEEAMRARMGISIHCRQCVQWTTVMNPWCKLHAHSPPVRNANNEYFCEDFQHLNPCRGDTPGEPTNRS